MILLIVLDCQCIVQFLALISCDNVASVSWILPNKMEQCIGICTSSSSIQQFSHDSVYLKTI